LFIVESLLTWKNKKNQLNDEIEKIKNGNNKARNSLISRYTPFIAKTVSAVTNRYIDINDSDEFSIGMLAFNSAIDSYTVSRGSFIKYAGIVIKSRVIDYLRKNKKNEIPFTDLDYDDGTNCIFDKPDSRARLGFENIESADGIRVFKNRLYEFNISFEELVESTPKHQDSVLNCIKLAKIITENKDLFEQFSKSKCLPLNKIMKFTDLHRRTVERNRKFIIAIVLLLKSDLNIIKGYLSFTERAGGNKL